jgi:NADH pyrophosphatase NudC (nudix superfamily)
MCRYESGEPECKSEDEVSEIHWMTYEEVLTDKNTPVWLKESIEKAEKSRIYYFNKTC